MKTPAIEYKPYTVLVGEKIVEIVYARTEKEAKKRALEVTKGYPAEKVTVLACKE